jgi:hypothetical protein
MFANGVDRSVLATRTPTHDRSKTMKHSVHTLIIISALLLIAGPAFGAAYMKLGDVKGESTDSKRDEAAKKKSDPSTAGRSATKAQPTGGATPKPTELPRTGQTPPSHRTPSDQFSLNYSKLPHDRKDQPVGRTPANTRSYKIQQAWPSKVTGGGSAGETSPAEAKR